MLNLISQTWISSLYTNTRAANDDDDDAVAEKPLETKRGKYTSYRLQSTCIQQNRKLIDGVGIHIRTRLMIVDKMLK